MIILYAQVSHLADFLMKKVENLDQHYTCCRRIGDHTLLLAILCLQLASEDSYLLSQGSALQLLSTAATFACLPWVWTYGPDNVHAYREEQSKVVCNCMISLESAIEALKVVTLRRQMQESF